MKTLYLMVLTAMVAACGGVGRASVAGDIGGETLEINTVYAWIESHAYTHQPESFALEPLPQTVLYLRLSGATFDPTRDQRYVDVVELLRLAQEESRKGSIYLAVVNGDKAARGATFTELSQRERREKEPGDIYLSDSRFRMAKPELDGEAPFEQTRPYWGGAGGLTVKLDAIGSEPGDVVTGTIELDVQRHERDPQSVVTGTLTVRFTAPLIQQRIAEANGDGFEP